jgi:hypothetical protein
MPRFAQWDGGRAVPLSSGGQLLGQPELGFQLRDAEALSAYASEQPVQILRIAQIRRGQLTACHLEGTLELSQVGIACAHLIAKPRHFGLQLFNAQRRVGSGSYGSCSWVYARG